MDRTGIPGAPLLPGGAGGGERAQQGAATAEEVDLSFLGRALDLARSGWGRVHPNPMVGCVLVREGRVVGEGWHRAFGMPHAEVEALREAGAEARGATAYVSLEPCSHHGKTPPCTLALREAGVSRVVYGAADPGDGAGGGSALRRAGIEVRGPLLTRVEARRENPAFFAHVEGRSHLTLKLALSLDARIAARPGERTPLTGESAGLWVHRLRAGFDGIVVGARTARTDDPLLTVRGDIEPRVAPARIVLDPGATLSPGAALLRPGPGGRVVVVTGPGAREAALRRLREAGAEVLDVPGSATGGGLDLRAVLESLRAMGLGALLCEGGGRLASALLQAALVDRMHLLVAPRVLGPRGVPAFPPGEAGEPPGGWVRTSAPVTLGADLLMTFDREVGD
jgi:diaminohydroxyphosphoribosylaminopyrimidine deaminase / 5-amino-6-(5-phosphoribosylamino)uracil reductase